MGSLQSQACSHARAELETGEGGRRWYTARQAHGKALGGKAKRVELSQGGPNSESGMS